MNKNFKEKNTDLKEYDDSLENIRQNHFQRLDNYINDGNKLSFKNYNCEEEKKTINNSSKYFTFSPGDMTIPSIQESDNLFIDNRKEINPITNPKSNKNQNNYNFTNNVNLQNLYNDKVSNYPFKANPNISDNSNRIFNETKKFAILKGIDIIINLFDSRVFRFIYSNMNSIYLNFFKRLKLIYELNIQGNPTSFNGKKIISRSNSSNSNFNEQNNYSNKSHETRIKNKEKIESQNNNAINSSRFVDNLIPFNSQSHQNNNSSNFNNTIGNNQNSENLMNNIHSIEVNGELNVDIKIKSKNDIHSDLPNENYFSFENFNLNAINKNANSLKNTTFVESVNNLDNHKNGSNSIYNNFKFNSFSNKNFLNNTFNRSNDNSDNTSNKNQNSDYRKTKNHNLNSNRNSNRNSNSVSPYNTISETTSKNNDQIENKNKLITEFAIKDPIKNNELLYFTKFFIKNILSFYKRNKSEFFFYSVKKIINHCNFNVVLGVLYKRIMIRHFTNLNHYFMRMRRINKVFNGILVLNSIYYKNLFHFFSIFGHHSRLFHIKKKYLLEFLNMLEAIRINKMKKKFIFSLAVNRYYDMKMPHFNRFLLILIKLINFNIRKKTFTSLKKMYYSQRLFHRNLNQLTVFLETIFLDKKRKVLGAIKDLSVRNNLIMRFMKRKHMMRLYYLKKVFQKFIDNALHTDKNLFTNIKLKKALKIYYYKQKLVLFKVNLKSHFLV